MSNKIYSTKELSALNKNRIPEHVAIIMDGNRRWAKRFIFSPEKGHRQGAEVLTNIVDSSLELGIKTLTVYAFSTENWQRSKTEVTVLMKILKDYLIKQREPMIRDGVRLKTIGDLSRFSSDVKQVVKETAEATAHGKNIDLVLALNYGSRDEICRAFRSIVEDYDKKKIKKEEIDEKLVSSYLDTASWKDPDLLIRTSGELRISNFLLWQISYTEIFTTAILWPDFTPKHFLEAIIDFQQRERRLGGA